MNITTQKIVKTWFNSFAEYAYQLEDGTTLYISYNSDSIRVVAPEAE